MIIFVVQIAYLCGNWVYNEDRNASLGDKTEKQQLLFEHWLWFEVMLALSYLGGCIIYLLFYQCKKPKIHFGVGDDAEEGGTSDFIAVNLFIITTNNTMFATACMGLLMFWQLPNNQLYWTSGLLATAQSLLFLLSIFLTPVSESRSLRYAKLMPKCIKWMSYGALVLLPSIIIVVNIVGCCT